MIWQEFEVNLFSTITNFTARTILIIGASDGQGKTGVPFAQFAGINALRLIHRGVLVFPN